MPDIEEFYGQPNMNDVKPETKIEVARASVSLVQDEDCCNDSNESVQTLDIESHDGGGGWYWTIKTERWAFDSVKELSSQLKVIIKKLEALKK